MDLQGDGGRWKAEEGGERLESAASELREEVRGVDTAARYGGEEFAIILPQAGPEGAFAVAERLRTRIERTEVPGVGTITASLGIATFLALFVLAPYLPLLFGRDYHDLAFFVRALSGTIVLVGAWSVAIDLLGASGRQGARALILNGANIFGSGLIAAATWLAAPIGTFVALYVIEGSVVISAWLVLLGLSRRSRERTATRVAGALAQSLSS